METGSPMAYLYVFHVSFLSKFNFLLFKVIIQVFYVSHNLSPSGLTLRYSHVFGFLYGLRIGSESKL